MTEKYTRQEKLMILAVALGGLLNPLNTTMITVALPSIQKDFQLDTSDISWLIASYFIISAIFTPFIGKLSDAYGRKKIMLTGFTVVIIASILAPLSPNMATLLILRGIQALGTSALFPAGIGVIRNHIKLRQNRVIGTLSVFATTSAAFGPTISGLLLKIGEWPVIFYVNIPIIILAIILTFIYVPKDEKKGKVSFQWDLGGMLLFSGLITSWMVFLLSLDDGFQIGTLILAIALTVVFFVYEKRQKQPFINVDFFQKNINVTLIYVQYVLSTVIFFSLLLTIPAFMQTVIGTASDTAGFTMLALSAFSIIMTPVATRWMEKAGFRIPLVIAATLGIVGMLLLFTVDATSPLFWIGLMLAVSGTSNGIQNIGLQNLLYSYIKPEESGIASGLLMTSRFIGNILASSLFGIAFASGMTGANLTTLTITLLIVAIILLPGMLFVTQKKQRFAGEN